MVDLKNYTELDLHVLLESETLTYTQLITDFCKSFNDSIVLIILLILTAWVVQSFVLPFITTQLKPLFDTYTSLQQMLDGSSVMMDTAGLLGTSYLLYIMYTTIGFSVPAIIWFTILNIIVIFITYTKIRSKWQ